MRTKTLIIGLAFVALGFIGSTENSILSDSEKSLFYTDSLHNLIRIVCGCLFLIAALIMPAFASSFLKLVGIVHFIIGLAGFIDIGTKEMVKVFGMLQMNAANNYLFIFLGGILIIAGLNKVRAVEF